MKRFIREVQVLGKQNVSHCSLW